MLSPSASKSSLQRRVIFCLYLCLLASDWLRWSWGPLVSLRLVQEEQLLSHESKLKQMSLELEEHRKNAPSADPKSREWEEFRLKEHYLTYEVRASLRHT